MAEGGYLVAVILQTNRDPTFAYPVYCETITTHTHHYSELRFFSCDENFLYLLS